MDIAERLKSESIGKLFFSLALPSVLAQLISLLYNVVDRVYLGHIPEVGAAALTGVGLCMPIIVIISAFTMLVAQGGAPLCGISLGENDKDKAERIIGTCVTCLVILSVALAAIILIWGRTFLMLFGASENTIIYALPYLRIYAMGNIFVMGSLGLNAFITTQGFTKFSMINVVIGAVLNIILDPLFIFVLNMGVRGAALATILSQAVVMIMGLRFLMGPKSLLKIKRQNLGVDRSLIVRILTLGLAPFIMQATEAALTISFNYSLQKYGGDVAVGAMTICSTVMQMLWIPSGGLGQGAQPIISYNFGAKDKARLKEMIRIMFTTLLVYFFVGWLIVESFPQIFIKMFNSDSQELFDLTMKALRIYVAGVGVFGLQNATQQFFVATGQAPASIFIACLRKLILLIPFIFILPMFFEDKVMAVFLAEPVSDIISVIVATTIFIISFPKIMKSMD